MRVKVHGLLSVNVCDPSPSGHIIWPVQLIVTPASDERSIGPALVSHVLSKSDATVWQSASVRPIGVTTLLVPEMVSKKCVVMFVL